MYTSVNGFKKPNETKTLKYIVIEFIVHIYLCSHDMKVRHRPVLDSGRRQIERNVRAVLQYIFCGSEKKRTGNKRTGKKTHRKKAHAKKSARGNALGKKAQIQLY